jgi:hypothetical protein
MGGTAGRLNCWPRLDSAAGLRFNERHEIPNRPSIARTMLLFKKKFLDAIRCGAKTQTIRLWKHRIMRGGQRSYIPGVGRIKVLSVEQVAVDELTDADAIPDGFPDAASLQAELKTIYGDKLNDGYKAFRVVFEREETDHAAP